MNEYCIQLNTLMEQLDRIEKKIDGTTSNRFLDIKQTAEYTSLGVSTLRASVAKGTLKCSRKLGKLLFKVTDVDKWLQS